jgi:hypothetical protein
MTRAELTALRGAIDTILAWPPAVRDLVAAWLAPEAPKERNPDGENRDRRLELSQQDSRHRALQGDAYINRHSISAHISDPDNTELGWLLERHPEYQDKARCGVDYFSIRNALYGTRCFEIVRIDGSKTDFSYLTCLD